MNYFPSALHYNHIFQSMNYQELIQTLDPNDFPSLYREALILGRLDVCQYLQFTREFQVPEHLIIDTIKTHHSTLISLLKNQITFEIINQLSELDVDYLLYYVNDIGLTSYHLISFILQLMADVKFHYDLSSTPIIASKLYLAIPLVTSQSTSQLNPKYIKIFQRQTIKKIYTELQQKLPLLPIIHLK